MDVKCNVLKQRKQRRTTMFRKSMLALAAVTAIFGATALTATDASAGGGKGGWHGKGGGWHGKHGGHGHGHGHRHRFGHGFYGYGYGYSDCGYILTPRGFMKYVCY
jgi:hypothetical protein